MIELALLAQIALSPVWIQVIKVGFGHTSAHEVEDIERRHSVITDACNRIAARREEGGASDFFFEDISRFDDHLHMDCGTRRKVSGRDFLVGVDHIAPLGIAAPYRAEFVEEVESGCRIVDEKYHANQCISVDAGGLTRIFDVAREAKAGITTIMGDARPLDGQVSSNLSFAYFPRVAGKSARLHKGPDYGNGAYSAKDYGHPSEENQRIGSSRHGFLGAKVLAVVVAGGAFVIVWAKIGSRVRPSREWDPVFVLLWLLAGAATIIAGSVWAVI